MICSKIADIQACIVAVSLYICCFTIVKDENNGLGGLKLQCPGLDEISLQDWEIDMTI